MTNLEQIFCGFFLTSFSFTIWPFSPSKTRGQKLALVSPKDGDGLRVYKSTLWLRRQRARAAPYIGLLRLVRIVGCILGDMNLFSILQKVGPSDKLL